MKTKLSIVLMMTLVVVGAGWFFTRQHLAAKDYPTETVWVNVDVVKEITQPQQIHAMGNLTAKSIEITPEIPGHVKAILFHDGAFVSQGDKLIQLDSAVYEAKYSSAIAKLAFSQNNFKRMTLLGKQGAISKQAIDQADADLKEKQAEADEAKVMLGKMVLTAPFAGVVSQSKVAAGDYVTTGKNLVTLTDTKHLRVEYTVPDKWLPTLRLGQIVNLTNSAYPNKVFTGAVSYIAPTINAENRSIAIYADVNNDENLLAPGMFIDLTQTLHSEEHVMIVPARSLMPILDGEQVYKLVDGKAYAVTVTIGKRMKDSVEIVQGLALGEQVVTDGQLKLKNGVSVKVKT